MSKRTRTTVRTSGSGPSSFEAGKLLDADPATRHLSVCWICTLRIDCEQAPGTTTDSHTLDHYYPVEDFPVLQNEPDNFRHAHFDCNSSRGKGDAERGLGEPMPAWW